DTPIQSITYIVIRYKRAIPFWDGFLLIKEKAKGKRQRAEKNRRNGLQLIAYSLQLFFPA
ncbi:MAG TPA: hypothetical protein VIM79_25350, partial [Niastella sp.]